MRTTHRLRQLSRRIGTASRQLQQIAGLLEAYDFPKRAADVYAYNYQLSKLKGEINYIATRDRDKRGAQSEPTE